MIKISYNQMKCFWLYKILLAPAPIISHAPSVMRTATRAPVVTPRVMPAKTKIMSILDRARVAMEESYGYEDDSNYGSNSPAYEYSRPSYSSGYHDDYEGDYYKPSSYGKLID